MSKDVIVKSGYVNPGLGSPFVLNPRGELPALQNQATLFIGTDALIAPTTYGAGYRVGAFWHMAGLPYPHRTDLLFGLPVVRALRATAVMPYLFAEIPFAPRNAIPELAWLTADLQQDMDEGKRNWLETILSKFVPRARELSRRHRYGLLAEMSTEQLVAIIGTHHFCSYPVDLDELRREAERGEIVPVPISDEIRRRNNEIIHSHNSILYGYY